MSLVVELLKIYPNLTIADFHPITGTISVANDADGKPDYIEKWQHTSSMPTGMKVGK